MGKSVKPRTKNRQGFSVLEALIYISLISATTVVFTSFTADVIRSSIKSMSVKEVNQSTRILISQIGQAIKSAQAIDSISETELVLTDASGTITFSYDAANDLVTIDTGSGAVPLSNASVRVTDLDFTQVSDSAIAVHLVVNQKNPNLPKTQQYQLELTSTFIPRPSLY